MLGFVCIVGVLLLVIVFVLLEGYVWVVDGLFGIGFGCVFDGVFVE